MTAKEKAKDLVESYKWFACWGRFEDEYENLQNSKKCALIAVDEIIYQMYDKYEIVDYRYWNEVKQEIEKL